MSALPLLTTSNRVRALTSTNAIRSGRFKLALHQAHDLTADVDAITDRLLVLVQISEWNGIRPIPDRDHAGVTDFGQRRRRFGSHRFALLRARQARCIKANATHDAQPA